MLVGPVTDPKAQSWPRMLSQWIRTAAHEHLFEAPLLLPQYRKTGVMTMLRGMNAVRRYRSDLGLAQIPLPVVVLRGALDRIAVQDRCQRLADTGDGEVTTVDGAAQMVPLTHPDFIVSAVRTILVRVARLACAERPTEDQEA